MTQVKYRLDAKQIVIVYSKTNDFGLFLKSKNISFKEINPTSIDKYTRSQLVKLTPEEKNSSFDSADKLYRLCSRKNSTAKIVYDDFSIAKAAKLYSRFMELETYIRLTATELIVKNGDSIKFYHRIKARRTKSRLQYYKSGKPDYKVSQTTMDELINDILLATGMPKIIDKMRLRSVKNDLRLIKEARNKVMYANVITDAKFNSYLTATQNVDRAIRDALTLELALSLSK